MFNLNALKKIKTETVRRNRGYKCSIEHLQKNAVFFNISDESVLLPHQTPHHWEFSRSREQQDLRNSNQNKHLSLIQTVNRSFKTSSHWHRWNSICKFNNFFPTKLIKTMSLSFDVYTERKNKTKTNSLLFNCKKDEAVTRKFLYINITKQYLNWECIMGAIVMETINIC